MSVYVVGFEGDLAEFFGSVVDLREWKEFTLEEEFISCEHRLSAIEAVLARQELEFRVVFGSCS